MSRIPGFAGYIPSYRDRVGSTFGHIEAGAPDSTRNVAPASMGRVPGFSGFVPGAKDTIGGTFGRTTRTLGRRADAALGRPMGDNSLAASGGRRSPPHPSVQQTSDGRDDLEDEREGPNGQFKKIAAADRTEVPGYSGFVRDDDRWPSGVSMTAPTKMPPGDAKLNKGKVSGFSGFVPGFWCDPDNIGLRFGVSTTKIEEQEAKRKQTTPRPAMGGRVRGAADGVAPGVRGPAPLEEVPGNDGEGGRPRQHPGKYALDMNEVSSNIARLNSMRFIPGYNGYTSGVRESYGINYGRKARGEVQASELLEHNLVVARPRPASKGKVEMPDSVGGKPGSVPGYTGYVPRTRELYGGTFGDTMWAGCEK